MNSWVITLIPVMESYKVFAAQNIFRRGGAASGEWPQACLTEMLKTSDMSHQEG